MTTGLIYRAAAEDSEYEEILSDARLVKPKLWKPGETLHKTVGGNIILRPFSADHTRENERLERRIRAYLRDHLKQLIAGGAGPSAWSFTNNSRTNFLSGDQAIGTDTFKLALHTSASNIGAASNAWSGVTNEVAAANGYTAGGGAITLSLSGTTTVTVALTDVSWTASGGTIVFRFGVLYEVSHNVTTYFTGDSAPADITVANGNTLTVSGANNLFTLA